MTDGLIRLGHTADSAYEARRRLKEAYDKLPWNIPMHYWESHEMNILNDYHHSEGMRKLDEAAAEIDAKKES